MFLGLYTAASALQVGVEQQEVTAANIANSSVPGYRERGLVFESFDRVLGRATPPTGDIVGADTARVYTNFRPGSIEKTGNPYDLAVAEPNLFFVLNGPNGPIYTRNGSFQRAANGQIVSQGGYVLQGDNGPLTVPNETIKSYIAEDGQLYTDGQPTGRVRLVSFGNLSQLTPVGPTLFSAPQEAGLQNASGRVLQGHRETSNVQPAEAMVKMILGNRYYEAAQRAMRSMSESVQLMTRPTSG